MRRSGPFFFRGRLTLGATFGSTSGMAARPRKPSYPNLEVRDGASGRRFRARVQVVHARKRGPWRKTPAEAYEDVLLLQAEGGVVSEAPVTIGEAVARRIAEARAAGVQANTLGLYESLGNRFSGEVWHPSTRLAALTPDELVAYVRKAKDLGRAPNTIIEKDLVFLGSLFGLAGLSSPVGEARKRLGGTLRRKTRHRDIFDPEEIKGLLRRVRNPEHRAIFTLAAYTGIRFGEILRCKIGDLDAKRNELVIPEPKDRSNPRRIPLVPESKAAFRYLGLKTGTPKRRKQPVLRLTENGLKSVVRRCKERIDDRLDLRTLRHTFITTLLMNGIPPAQVMFLAGHKSLTTTMKYLHELETRKPDAVKTLARAFSAPKRPKTTPGP